MKKKLIVLALLLGSAAVLLSSCFSIPKNFKMTVADATPDQGAAVIFSGGKSGGMLITIIVKKCNGNDVVDALYGKRYIGSNDKTQLIVPSGDNNFTFDIFYSIGDTTYQYKNLELQYSLESGKKYNFKGRADTATGSRFFGAALKGTEFFVEIYDATEKNAVMLKEWKLGER